MGLSCHDEDSSYVYQNECTMEEPFKTTLVGYHSHTIKLTHLKCTAQMIYSQRITLCNYQHEPVLEHFHYPSKIPHACRVNQVLPTSSGKVDLISVFLPSPPNLDMSHKWVIQSAVLCDWFHSLSMFCKVHSCKVFVTSLVAKWLRHQASIAEVLSLAGELRSHMLHGTVKKLKKKKKKNFMYLYGQIMFHYTVNYILFIQLPKGKFWVFSFWLS